MGVLGGLGIFPVVDLPAFLAGVVFFLEDTDACVLEVDFAAFLADDAAAFLAAGFFDEGVVFLFTLFFAGFFFRGFFLAGVFLAVEEVFPGAAFFDAGFLDGRAAFLGAGFLAGVFFGAAFLRDAGFLDAVFPDGERFAADFPAAFLAGGVFFFTGFLLVLFLAGTGFFLGLTMILGGLCF